MAIARIAMPEIREEGQGAIAVQKDPIAEGTTQTWLANSLVYTSGTGASVVLNKCATDAVLCFGLAPQAAVGSGTATALVVPPNYLFGRNHYPFDVRDRIIEMNIVGTIGTMGTTSGAAWDGTGTSGVALAPGQQYAILCPTSGTYNGFQFVDVTDTTNKLVEIVALAPNQATSDNNPRVWVKIINDGTKLQG